MFANDSENMAIQNHNVKKLPNKVKRPYLVKNGICPPFLSISESQRQHRGELGFAIHMLCLT